MDDFDDRRLGRNGTDIPSLRAVQQAIHRIVRGKWSGWSQSDREDLESLVLEKYFAAFGRVRLPDDDDGNPQVPAAWLRKVATNAGIDKFRKDQVRPFDPTDFGNLDDPLLEARLFNAVGGLPHLSSVVASRTDLERALVALGDAYPADLSLIRWRLIEDKSVEDIAELVQKSTETTRKAIQRAVQRLRQLLQTTVDIY